MYDIHDALTGTICRLSLYSPAVFNTIIGLTRKETASIETLGVSVHRGHISLAYNPDFVKKLTDAELGFTLAHEMMHVLLHHCTHRSSNSRARAYKENVAMDLAVNSLIHNGNGITMPVFKEETGRHKVGDPIGLLPDQFGFAPNQTFEQYLALLDAKYPDTEIIFSGMDGTSSGIPKIDPNCPLGAITSDRIANDHGNGYDEDSFVDDRIRNIVERIERNHLWGNMTSHDIETVKKAQDQPLKWTDLLRFYAGQFITFKQEPSRRRWNKHYGKPFLGTKYKSTSPVAVYTDTSASVGSEDLSRFIVEIERISYYTPVYHWCFDVEIHDPETPQVFSRASIDSIDFTGRGGTSFLEIFTHAKKHNMCQIIILTDGCAESISPKVVDGLDVVWVITRGGDTNGKPGRIIEMN